MTLATLLLVIALVLFLIVAFAGLFPQALGRLGNRVNLMALGWALITIVFIMDRVS